MPQPGTLSDPTVFIRELEDAWLPPPSTNPEFTKWFGDMLQRVAKRNSYHCQSKQCAEKPGEWLNIDHVLTHKYNWRSFPDVVVEHENGDFIPTPANCPAYYDEKSPITWAFWKAISVQAHLHVLAAYPWKDQKKEIFTQFSEMAEAWAQFYKRVFQCLFLFGWWNRNNDDACEPISLYSVYLLRVSPGQQAEWCEQRWAPNSR